MKKIILLLCMLPTLIATSCENDDDSNRNDSLPPATQTGENTVGCLVNGEVFLPKAEGINPAVVVNYEFINGQFFFRLVFKDLRGTTNKTVTVGTGYLDLQANQTYLLNKNFDDDGDYTGGGGTYSTSTLNTYQTNINILGELTITRVDTSNSIISGTFWFDAVNEQGEIIEIRDGRFDYEY
jgi:hypothetical protein